MIKRTFLIKGDILFFIMNSLDFIPFLNKEIHELRTLKVDQVEINFQFRNFTIGYYFESLR